MTPVIRALACALLVGVSVGSAAGQVGHIAHSLRRGQIDFYDGYSLVAWNAKRTQINASGTVVGTLRPDPADPSGRLVQATHTELNQDRFIYEVPLQYLATGVALSETNHKADEFRMLVQYRWNFPEGVPPTGTRHGFLRLIESGGGEFGVEALGFALLGLQTGVESVQMAADSSYIVDSSVSMAGLRDQWVTYLVEYRRRDDSIDGVMRVTFAPGLQSTAEAVRTHPGAVIPIDESHFRTRQVGAFQIEDNPVSHDTLFDSYIRAVGWAADGDDPEIIDQMLVGQLRDPSDEAINVFALAPGGAFKVDWHLDGAIRMAVRSWPADEPEPAPGESETAKVPLTVANRWAGSVRVTGISPAAQAYKFRVILYDAVDDNDFIEAGHVLDYEPPIGSFKMLVGTCVQSSGAAHPYWFFKNAMDNGARHAVIVDDIGYVDGTLDGNPSSTFDEFTGSYYEMMHDQFMAGFGRQGCIIVRHGDHQWRNEWDINDRVEQPAIWDAGLAAWNLFFQDAMEGTIDPFYQDPLLIDHLARAFDWGPFRIVAFDDVTQYNFPVHDSLIDHTPDGSGQKQDLKDAWAGTTKPLLMMLTSRVAGPIEVRNPTFWNLNNAYIQEFAELEADIALNAPEPRTIIFSGDSHITGINEPITPNQRLFEATIGPLASKRFNGLIPNDLDSIQQPRDAKRLFAMTEGVTAQQMVRLYGLAEIDYQTITLSVRDGEPDDTLYWTSDPFMYRVPCDCDTDGVAGVTVLDLLAFLSSWYAAGPGADLTGDLVVDSNDLLAFLSCWFPAVEVGDCFEG